MIRRITTWFAALCVCFSVATPATAASILDSYGLNYSGSGTEIIDITGFNTSTGLGGIDITITGVGAHSFDAFFDHDIDRADNTFLNEYGAVSGSAVAGQSWEIDEPGYRNPTPGNIFSNYQASTLDNTNAIPSGSNDDVSMALGWDFNLELGELALISIALGSVAPNGGFYLIQTDPDSNESIYFSSSLDISAIPVPAAIWLFGSGLVGLIGLGRRRSGMSNH